MEEEGGEIFTSPTVFSSTAHSQFHLPSLILVRILHRKPNNKLKKRFSLVAEIQIPVVAYSDLKM